MPTLPPMFRIRLNRLVAAPMDSGRIRSTVTVVSGTNRSPNPTPWMNCGQKKSQKPAFRLSVPSQYIVAALTMNPSATRRLGSVRSIACPTSGIATTEPRPRGAITQPACSAG